VSHEKGDYRSSRKIGFRFESFGFNCGISEQEWDDLPGQIRDAHQFVCRHRSELQDFVRVWKDAELNLDFPYYSNLNGKTFNHSEFFSHEFLKEISALRIAIKLTEYHKGKNEES